MVKEANKLFNLLLPFNQYQELRNLRRKTDIPIAEIIRQGISIVLERAKAGNPTTTKE